MRPKARRSSSLGRAYTAGTDFHLSPLSSPRRWSATHARCKQRPVALTGLRRRPEPRRYGVAAGLVSPDAKWYRSSHRPAIHRAHPPALSAKSRLRAFGFLDTAARGPTRGVDNHYESPAAGPEHQRCTKDHGVKIILIWNRRGDHRPRSTRGIRQKHEGSWRRGIRPGPVFRPAQVSCPLMYPGTPLWTPARPGGLWCTVWISEKRFCTGIFKKRLTAIQTNFGSAHFFRTWSESPPRPPKGPEGARGPPLDPPAPSWPAVGRCQAPAGEPPQPPPGPARSPTPLPRPPRGPRPDRRSRSKARLLARRMVPGRGPGRASSRRYGRLKLGDGTREPSDGTRKRSGPALPGRPRRSPAGPRRLRPPAALPCPLPCLGGWGAKRAGCPVLTALAQNCKANTCNLQPLSAQPGPRRSPGPLRAGQPPGAASDPLGVFPAPGRPWPALRRPAGERPRRDKVAGHGTRKPAQAQELARATREPAR